MVARSQVVASVVTWNSEREVAACLRSLKRALEGISSRLVVFDNASYDRTVAVVEQTGLAVTVIRSETNLGFGAAHNRVFKDWGLESDFFLIVNPDVVVDADCVRGLLLALELHPDWAMVAPQLLNQDGTLAFNAFTTQPTPERLVCQDVWNFSGIAGLARRCWKAGHPRDLAEIQHATGALLFVRSSQFCEVGGFDENFFLYYEETDLCLELKKRGAKIGFVGTSRATHYGGASAEQRPDSRRLSLRSRLRFARKHYGTRGAVFVACSLPFTEGLRAWYRAVKTWSQS